jgi:L-asparaginase II
MNARPRINPVLVAVSRDKGGETVYRGAAAVDDARGNIVVAWEDVDTPFLPRSAVKPYL